MTDTPITRGTVVIATQPGIQDVAPGTLGIVDWFDTARANGRVVFEGVGGRSNVPRAWLRVADRTAVRRATKAVGKAKESEGET